jgi:tetratricopeptide (TPR) repeat protein
MVPEMAAHGNPPSSDGRDVLKAEAGNPSARGANGVVASSSNHGDPAQALRREAAARQARGRFAEAGALLQRAVDLAPLDPAAWSALADCLLQDRRPEAALAVCDLGLQRLPTAPGLICAKARALQSVSRVAEAAARYRQALAVDPASVDARLGLALQAVEAGAWDEAQTLATPLPGARAMGPAIDWLLARIALGRGEPGAALAAVRRALAGAGLTPDQRAEAELLAGEALDGLGRPAEAFAAFTRGKGALRALYATRAAGREGEAEKLGRLAAWFAAADPAPWRTAPAAAPDPDRPGHAFLLGFPRSGTTLLEQALAGHPDLASLEEAPTLAEPYDALMTTPAGLERLARLSAAEAATWRAGYWREVDARCPEARGRLFLDKAPAGTLYLPLIAKLFPQAKVLFALRDPRDVVLSCFRNSFQMNALTYAFTDLAETARCYTATMALAEAGRQVLPLAVTEVRLERLVDDFEGELRRICAFLGLEFAPGMTDVAATARRRTPRTPSAAQVRAGVNRQGIGRRRAYAAELAPIRPILAPWIERFGYDPDWDGAAG